METKPMKNKNNTQTMGAWMNRLWSKIDPHNMSLQVRLALLTMVVSIPLLLISNLAMASRAERYLRENTDLELEKTNTGLVEKTSVWLTQNVNVLRQLSLLPQIISMDPEQQKGILKRTGQAFNHMYLVHTIDTNAMNVARSDNQPLIDYKDRHYMQRALLGETVTFQVVIGKTTYEPALAAAVPVWSDSGKILGAVAFASDLNAISNSILSQTTINDDVMSTFIVDESNKVIAHPNKDISNKMTDYSNYPPVVALRQGRRGFYDFKDADGVAYRAYLSELSNGWGVISQEERSMAVARVNQYRLMAATVSLLAAALMVGGSTLMVRRSFKSVHDLMETVTAVSQGDLNREARVERNDEIGQLARAFNGMTLKLRGTVDTLEQNVADRTRMIETSFEVSRRLSTILNLKDLIREVADQLQQAFHYYHVHIYLFDETKQNLVMSGGTGEAGRAMLARGHRIARGRGLVGRAADSNIPVLVQDTHSDPHWLPNSLLPETKSEVAVPIALSDYVIGVLDVQQNEVGGLTSLDMELLQSIANQVAIAVQNARSYEQVQERADREASIAEIHQKIQQSSSVEAVMEVAVSELGKLLNARHTAGEIRPRRITDSKN